MPFEPDQPPLAVHEVAPAVTHVSVEDCPLVTGFGLALSVTETAEPDIERGTTAQLA
jgi:hypothetical protein